MAKNKDEKKVSKSKSTGKTPQISENQNQSHNTIKESQGKNTKR